MRGTMAVLHFSPAGSTQNMAEVVARRIGERPEVCDLTEREGVRPAFSPDDVVVVAIPVFMGRVPGPAIEALKDIAGGGARAVALAVYGNRHYNDALLELRDILKAQGFRVIAGAALVAQHSIIPAIGAGRPHAEDWEEIARFADSVKKKIEAGDNTEPEMPGDRPYIELKPVKRPIFVAESCTGCGLCARRCPVGAIPTGDVKATDYDVCFGCMQCIRQCPAGARDFAPEVNAELGQRASKEPYASPKKNICIV